MSLLAMGMAITGTQAFAQSTGTLDFDKEIVVTGTHDNARRGIDGLVIPDTSKAKLELNQAFIEHQVPGQSINDIINYLPGVSFQNNDPYGGAGGTLTIRGFDATRISETFDGVTLNDDGNYALYAQELLDTEVIDKVTVNLGTTDVDSPTSSASGSTVNFISHMPTDKTHAKLVASGGTDHYYRVFGMIDTGTFGPWGTKAWFSASKTQNDSPFNNYGHIRKHEFNGRIYQPLSKPGDFISLAGFYVVLRNNFSGSVPLSNTALAADSGSGLTSFPATTGPGSYYNYSGCTTATGTKGVADSANSCGSAFDYRYNPANLLNLRAAMKLTLTDKLTFTFDPSYQFTKANGGGTANAYESGCYLVSGKCTTASATSIPSGTPLYGYVNGSYYLGKDLNGDGDSIDSVRMLVPSQTKTHRVALTTSLRYDAAPSQTLRVAYAFARSDITQSGEMTPIGSDGGALNVWAVNNPISDTGGSLIQKRDTDSIATMHQVSGEYRGKFLDNRLTVTAGLRVPFLQRQLTNYCFTRNAGGGVSCAFGDSAAAYQAAFPYSIGSSGSPSGSALPQTRKYSYSAVLPNAGLTFVLPVGETFFNYSKGYSAPQTTALYQSFYFQQGTPGVEAQPEKTDNFDLGWRINDRKVTAQVDLWYTHFSNRLGTAYNPTEGTSIYSNLGSVKRYGIDANLAYNVNEHVTAMVFGSWLHSEIQSNVTAGSCSTTMVAIGVNGCTTVNQLAYYQTAGKFESGIPQYTVGGRLQGNYGPLLFGVQLKHTGARYVNDQNTPFLSSGNTGVTDGAVVYPAKTPEYTLVDIDVRMKLAALGLHNDSSYVQLNVSNLFNQHYVGGFSATTSPTQTFTGTLTNAQIGAPRAVIGTLVLGF
ncbi:TonB-dependent receptor-like protein [Novosphingobium nitrogenifigens DSM 19370]|uniref:TonB-dependent receptor-like protein n=1 Tax=Novosphingobium nitrogenifigens DSM 19370 TaxID=983920 RepID=F1Z836_9SPHN|nr:TonB-dependent receptor-like protein [Novosphingobium nitrogenifigens DSM 19370]